MPGPDTLWTPEEIEAAIAAYADMAQRLSNGEKVNKQQVYRSLASESGRSTGTYNRKFCNISHVLVGMGLPHIPGLNPLNKIGAPAIALMEQIITTGGYFATAPPALPADEIIVLPVPAASPMPGVPPGNATPGRRMAEVEVIDRDQDVVRWVLAAAAGHCENCGQPAPFLRVNGTPYLEVHHVKRLADYGRDWVTNAVALCPNCHREFHHGANAAQLAIDIIEKVGRLVAE